eukprot:819658-Rhodomonas_salina.1
MLRHARPISARRTLGQGATFFGEERALRGVVSAREEAQALVVHAAHARTHVSAAAIHGCTASVNRRKALMNGRMATINGRIGGENGSIAGEDSRMTAQT